MSFPARLLLRLLLNIAFVWFLARFLGTIFLMTGGFPAIFLLGFLLTAIDLLIRPFLSLITLPLRLFLSILNTIVLSGLSLAVLVVIGREFPPSVLTLALSGGLRDIFLLIAIFGLRDVFLRSFVR